MGWAGLGPPRPRPRRLDAPPAGAVPPSTQHVLGGLPPPVTDRRWSVRGRKFSPPGSVQHQSPHCGLEMQVREVSTPRQGRGCSPTAEAASLSLPTLQGGGGGGAEDCPAAPAHHLRMRRDPTVCRGRPLWKASIHSGKRTGKSGIRRGISIPQDEMLLLLLFHDFLNYFLHPRGQ